MHVDVGLRRWTMTRGFLARQTHQLVAAVLVLAAPAAVAVAQDGHAHAGVSASSRDAGALVQAVREATERFKDVNVAEAEGYALQFGCVSGPDAGAMGMHFVNFPLVADGELDPAHPEIVIYEPQPDGRLRLIGADFLIFKADWEAKHPNSGAPELMGQLFHFFDAPNRFGLPPFYTLHVWAWKDSPTGTFVNWNTNVSCNAFNGR
jgi:hypothetical protein